MKVWHIKIPRKSPVSLKKKSALETVKRLILPRGWLGQMAQTKMTGKTSACSDKKGCKMTHIKLKKSDVRHASIGGITETTGRCMSNQGPSQTGLRYQTENVVFSFGASF